MLTFSFPPKIKIKMKGKIKPNSSAAKKIYPGVKRILIPFKKGIPDFTRTEHGL